MITNTNSMIKFDLFYITIFFRKQGIDRLFQTSKFAQDSKDDND